jgi:hypothetical protein
MSPIEIMNLCEFVYRGNINMVKSANLHFRNQDQDSFQPHEIVTVQQYKDGYKMPLGQIGQKVPISRENCKVDVTHSLRHAFMAY